MFLAWLTLAVVSAIVCAAVAGSKGHSAATWAVVALVVWPVGLIGVLALGNRKTEILLRRQLALEHGLADERLDQDMLEAGLREKTESEKRRDRNAAAVMSLFIAAVIAIALLVWGFWR